MPRVDMDMTSGRMGRWHAPEGAHVEKGATLFEIETDKAAMEVDAPASGVLKFVAASEGDVLPVGACIGWIVPEGESFAPPSEKADARAPSPRPSPNSPSRDGRPIERPIAPDEGECCKRTQAHGIRMRVSAANGPKLMAFRGARASARAPHLRLDERRGSAACGSRA